MSKSDSLEFLPDVMVPQKKKYNGCTGANLPTNIKDKLEQALEKRNAGRVSTFTEEGAQTLLESIAEGSTIKTACEKIGIQRSTFYIWRDLVPGFSDMVRRAQELQADSMVDDNVQLLENVNVSSGDVDPRLAMAALRKAEQVARFKFDLAKCLNSKYIEKKQNMNLNVNATVTDADVSSWFNK